MSFCKVEDADTLVGSGGVTLPPTNITATYIKYRIDAKCFSKIEGAHLRMRFGLFDGEEYLLFHEIYWSLPRQLDGKQTLQFLFYAHLPRADKERGSSRSLIYLFGFDHESGFEEFMVKHEGKWPRNNLPEPQLIACLRSHRCGAGARRGT